MYKHFTHVFVGEMSWWPNVLTNRQARTTKMATEGFIVALKKKKVHRQFNLQLFQRLMVQLFSSLSSTFLSLEGKEKVEFLKKSY